MRFVPSPCGVTCNASRDRKLQQLPREKSSGAIALLTDKDVAERRAFSGRNGHNGNVI